MKLLLFYPTHFCTGMKPIGLSTLKAYLQRHGHEVRIFDTAQYAIKEHESEVFVTSRLGTFKPVGDSERHLLEQELVTKDELMKIILNVIDDFKPGLLGVSLLTNNLALVKEYFSFIKRYVSIPLIAGGIHPTVAPEQTIGLDFVDMICVGYGERPLLRLMDSGLTDHFVRNIWFKENGRIIRNPVLENSVDFEDYEFPNWDDFSNVQFYKPFQGKVMRYGDVEFGRGCPFSCTFCIVAHLRKELNYKCQKKRNEKMIEELVFLKEKYSIEIFRFWDELFLLVNDAQLEEFAKLYKRYVDVPFIIETTAESITKKRAKLLREIKCVSASMGLESGNEWLRNKVLNKRTPNRAYIDSFKIINDYGINTTAYNMLGLPDETEDMIRDTIELNRECGVRTPAKGLFYPFPGTSLRRYCVEKGYLAADFQDDIDEASLFGNSVLKQDHNIRPERLKHYLEYFSAYVKLPVEMYPDIMRSSIGDEVGNRLKDKIQELIQK